MWDFSPKNEIVVSELFRQIAALGEGIEGVTILGGEPLDQYDETLMLLRLCANAGLSTMLFTGYELDEMERNGTSGVKRALDILITGRYEEDKRTLQRQWVGSANQEIHFLSDRFSSLDIKDGNYMEITLNNDGSLTVFGFPPWQFS